MRETEKQKKLIKKKKKAVMERIREAEERSKRDRRGYQQKDKKVRAKERQLPLLISQWQQLAVSLFS